MKKNDTVSWKWGNGTAKGVVTEVCPKRTEITTKGNTVTRDGSPKDPALKIKQESGTIVLKLKSEVQKAG